MSATPNIYLPSENVVRYEDIVSSNGKALKVVVPVTRRLDVRLESKKLNPIYTTGMRCSGSERLLASEGAYWHFYSPESVEGMLAAL